MAIAHLAHAELESTNDSLSIPSSKTFSCITKPEELSMSDFRSNNAIILGDAGEVLKCIESNVVQTVITSPPYWSLRDYGVDGQIGHNDTLKKYIDTLVSIFDEVHRVLRNDGTLWLNIGDAYTSGNRKWRAPDRKNPARAMCERPPTPDGLKKKDLIGIPWRLAFALQDKGWYLRSEVIWRKPNCQPESVRDRPTNEHERIFLLTKSEHYKYDIDSVRGPNNRRLRTVWDINTKPSKMASGHFATFPEELVERCLAITSDVDDIVLDPFLGSGTTTVVAAKKQRRFIGIDISPEYIQMSKLRLCDMGLSERHTSGA